MADQTITNSSGQTAVIASPVTTVVVNGTVSPISIPADAASPTLIPQQPVSNLPLNSISAPATNPNSRGVNDISDIRKGVTQINLPIRAEKRLIPVTTTAQDIQQEFSEFNDFVNGGAAQQENQISNTDFYITPKTAAKSWLNDYIKVRIPHRGVNTTTMMPDTSQDVEFRFLTNPTTLSVNRQMVDANSLTRGGWQFGVWGEDTFIIQLSGQSAGSYFTLGLTDEFSYYTVSYRNLMQLQQLFENNGYWFEGEEYNEGPLAPDYLRRRIRMHQDVELWAGNFIWYGMFDGLSISQDAERPFLLNFQLSFFAWKERFRSTSPYWNSIINTVQRGQSYSAVETQSVQQETNNALAQYTPPSAASQTTQISSALASPEASGFASSTTDSGVVNGLTLGSDGQYYPASSISSSGEIIGPPATQQPYANTPAVAAAASENLSPNISTTVMDTVGVSPLNTLINSPYSGQVNLPNGGQVTTIGVGQNDPEFQP